MNNCSEYKIRSRQDLQDFLQQEYNQYRQYQCPDARSYWCMRFKREPFIEIMHWQRIARIADYHDFMYHTTGSQQHRLKYLWYTRKRNLLGNKIGLEINTIRIGKGLMIYHFNNVINPEAVIGENLHLHGGNVIGNAGKADNLCPIIGNNVMLGAGAKVFGSIKIADDIKIGAGAIVVSSFTEPGITIGGIPARKIR